MSEKGNGSSHPPCVVDVNAGMGVGEMGVRVWARETMFEQGGGEGEGGGTRHQGVKGRNISGFLSWRILTVLKILFEEESKNIMVYFFVAHGLPQPEKTISLDPPHFFEKECLI